MNGPEFDELRSPSFSTYKIAICTGGRGKLEMGYFHNFKTFTGCFINSEKIMSTFNLPWKPGTAPIPLSCPTLGSLKSKDSIDTSCICWIHVAIHLNKIIYIYIYIEGEIVYIKSIYFLVRRVNVFFFSESTL